MVARARGLQRPVGGDEGADVYPRPSEKSLFVLEDKIKRARPPRNAGLVLCLLVRRFGIELDVFFDAHVLDHGQLSIEEILVSFFVF